MDLCTSNVRNVSGFSRVLTNGVYLRFLRSFLSFEAPLLAMKANV